MAYALILKHVGVLYQTLYLVATAMGLGPCGVGGGQAELLSRAIGSNYLAESPVGELLLGSRPDGRPGSGARRAG
jgi:SagB-type dehydrogenase family enzyme